MEVCHVTVGAAGSGKQNGVLVVVDALLREHEKITEASCISIVKYDKVSTRANTIYQRFGINLFWTFYNKAKSKNIIFHFHGGLNYQLHILAVFLWVLGAKYCVSPHGAFSNTGRKLPFSKTIYIKTIVAWYLKRSQFVHVFGDGDVFLLAKYQIQTTLFIAPNGMYPIISKKNPRSVHRANGILRLGFCGRVNYKEKGLEIIPEILQNLVVSGYSVSFHVIGSGPDESNLKHELGERGLSETVIFHGALFGENKFDSLKNIDIFLYPSRHEGMPLAPLEALASGAKILISPETNLRHYLSGITGVILVATRDAKDWSNAIIEADDTILDQDVVHKTLTTTLAWPKIAADFVKRYELIRRI